MYQRAAPPKNGPPVAAVATVPVGFVPDATYMDSGRLRTMVFATESKQNFGSTGRSICFENLLFLRFSPFSQHPGHRTLSFPNLICQNQHQCKITSSNRKQRWTSIIWRLDDSIIDNKNSCNNHLRITISIPHQYYSSYIPPVVLFCSLCL